MVATIAHKISHLSRTKVKNELHCTSTPSYTLMGSTVLALCTFLYNFIIGKGGLIVVSCACVSSIMIFQCLNRFSCHFI